MEDGKQGKLEASGMGKAGVCGFVYFSLNCDRDIPLPYFSLCGWIYDSDTCFGFFYFRESKAHVKVKTW